MIQSQNNVNVKMNYNSLTLEGVRVNEEVDLSTSEQNNSRKVILEWEELVKL